MKRAVPIVAIMLVLAAVTGMGQSAQQTPQAKPAPPQKPATPPPAAQPTSVPVPPDYVIGPEDQLSIVFWTEPKMSADSLVVRPDGKISLPLLNDIQAAGFTPDQLREKLAQAASKYIEDTTVTVVVRQINSRKVFITGSVAHPGPYSLANSMTVLQLIAVAGGLGEWADQKNIAIMRVENGRPTTYRFNYKEVVQGKNLKQNIELRPGDTVIVP
jgi:polysaccharide export outer membrane protein